MARRWAVETRVLSWLSLWLWALLCSGVVVALRLR
jgi:hypothetical protein